MASNVTLQSDKEPSLVQRISEIYFTKVNHQWWGTKFGSSSSLSGWCRSMECCQFTVLSKPKFDPAQPAPSAAEMANLNATIADLGIQIFILFSGIFAAGGVVVFAQDALIGEKRSGTAAWLLSKPVSRTAFLTAKLAADAIGILVTFVIVQGVIGYYYLTSRHWQ